MSDVVAKIDRLLEKSNELGNGPRRIEVLDEAVRLADEHSLAEAGFRVRLVLMEAATFAGRPDILLTAFSWCLAEYDRRPEQFDQGDLLWKYKWAVGNVVEFPHVPRAQIESMLADMSERFEKAGSTLHAVHQARREILTDMGDLAGAAQATAQLAATRRDWLSDCRACVQDVTAGHLADSGRDEEALAAAAGILAGRVKCTHVPHRTYAKLLLPLLRLGRVDEALSCHQEGLRLIGDNPQFLAAAARHLEFLALTGQPDQALQVMQMHLANAHSAPSSHGRMNFYGAVRLLLELLLEQGQEELRLRLPPAFPLYRPDAAYETGTLLQWFAREVEALTAQFDARNGNDHYARWLADMLQRKELANGVPLEEEADY